MKRYINFTSIFVALALSATSALATDIRVGTGGEKGNYYGMANDIKTYCQSALGSNNLDIQVSGGSVVNLVGMGNKEYDMGLVQEDVLQFMAKKDPNRVNQNRLKIVSGMHTETIHLLIPKGYKPQSDEGGLFAKGLSLFSGNNTPAKLDINLLKNQTVGSWGGSVISAKALSYFQSLNLNIVELDDNARVNPNMPLIIVGGQPYKPVADYLATGKWNLVGIDYDQIRTQAPFYVQTTANYGKTSAVSTVAVRALLIGKAFRKEERNEVMSLLASCIDSNLADLADDSNTNPNWPSVYEAEQAGVATNWSYFKMK